MEEPEVVEVEVEKVETPVEPEPIAPEWVQVYEDLVSYFVLGGFTKREVFLFHLTLTICFMCLQF